MVGGTKTAFWASGIFCFIERLGSPEKQSYVRLSHNQRGRPLRWTIVRFDSCLPKYDLDRIYFRVETCVTQFIKTQKQTKLLVRTELEREREKDCERIDTHIRAFPLLACALKFKIFLICFSPSLFIIRERLLPKRERERERTNAMMRNASENGSDDFDENKKNSLKRKRNVSSSVSPSDFDMFALVYNFLQSNGYKDAAEKMTKEMKRRLKTPKSFSEEKEEEKEENTKLRKKKKLMMVQMLNALGTKNGSQEADKEALLPRVKPLREIMGEFLSMKAKELRRKKSTNEPMKMIFRQCEEAFGNIAMEEAEKETTAGLRNDDDGREGVVGIIAARGEDEDGTAAEVLAVAAAEATTGAAAARPRQQRVEVEQNIAAATNTTNHQERRNKKKQAAPQRKHKQTIYKQSLDDANVREKIADVIVRTLHKKTGRTPNPTPTMNSAKSNKNIEREELAFSDVEEDEEEDDEFGHHVTELELDKIADLMEKPEDTMETANAILGSLMESTDNDLGRFLEDLVAQTEHGNTKEINKLPTPKKRLLLKEDCKAANLIETNNGQKTP